MACYGLAHSFSNSSQITTAQYEDLHLHYITSHPPDAVLFPFLHGLEGNNEAQNMFFTTQGQSVLTTNPGESQSLRRNTVPVPKYRGLMAVVCEDDLDSPSQLGLLDRSYSYSSNCSDNSDYDFDDDDESEEYELDDELAEPEQGQDTAMHMDVDVVDIPEDSSPIHSHNAIQIVGIGSDEKHMHPVHHRLPPVKPIQTTNLNSTDSSASSSLSSCEDSLFESGDTTATPATSQSVWFCDVLLFILISIQLISISVSFLKIKAHHSQNTQLCAWNTSQKASSHSSPHFHLPCQRSHPSS